jgi:protoporphyrin/coproporphyrin ferrochelatase
MNKKKKVSVILFNLGGPCCKAAIQPFLFNLFNDPAIIGLPNPFRKWLASFISSRRVHEATEIYNKMGGASPILKNTYNQVKALKDSLLDELKEAYELDISLLMRYTFPDINYIQERLDHFKPDQIILLSLYPQYSTTTVASSVKQFREQITNFSDVSIIESYHDHPLFLESYAHLIKEKLKSVSSTTLNPIILFSAHGIPVNRVKRGDPYQEHVEGSVAGILQLLKDYSFDYEICYQSRVGPLKWLEPSISKLIPKYAKEKRSIMVVPVSFVSEHSETLVELDIQYKEIAMENGAEEYIRVPAVADDIRYINCLKALVLDKIN